MTFTLAALTLSVIILGVSFGYNDRDPDVVHSMDIILSKKSNLETPEDPDYLSENNQIGGGNQEKQSRPTNLISATSPIEDGFSKQQTEEQRKQQTKQDNTKAITTQSSETKTKNNQRQLDTVNTFPATPKLMSLHLI